MSNLSGSSIGNPSSRDIRRVVGVPKRCWCGVEIVALISKSKNNPYRRYYRCAFAVAHKLSNDNHTFKWVDEALLDEIEELSARTANLTETMIQLKEDRMNIDNMVRQKVQMMVEAEIVNRQKEVVVEGKCSIRNLMLGFGVGFTIVLLCSKLLV